MPDPPLPKHQPPSPVIRRPAGTVPPYAELHCRTNFSFLEGASHPHELIARACELGYRALAITDHASLAGIVRAHVAAKEAGLKLVVGAEIAPAGGPARLLLWAVDRGGYANLCRLLTHGRRSAPKGQCLLTMDDVAAHARGLLAGPLLAEADVAQLRQCRDIFGRDCYGVAELTCGPHDRALLRQMHQRAQAAGLPIVVANDVHYHAAWRRPLHDVLTAIRHGCSVAELGERRFPNAERHLKAPAAMHHRFVEWPEAVARTVEIADRCTFSLDELRYDYPVELSPPGRTPFEHLVELTWIGARDRYPNGIPDKVRQLIEHELRLIQELRYEAYFLTVWDLVRFARRRGILCQGRGSAANSAVCFCLGITSVDPERIDVLFERFVSKDRNEAPDIDVDFEHERREEVLQYIYEKYGRDRTAMTAEVITYRQRSAVRETAKALGLSLEAADRLAKAFDHHSRRDQEQMAARLREGGLDPNSRLARQLVWLVNQLLGFPRHLSQHVGGMVITNSPLCELAPIENAAMPGRTVIPWDKDDLDALGILKVDCLSLGMLTAIRKCFDLIAEQQRRLGHETAPRLTLATVPPEDPAVYDMICRADTMGVFQIESRAQMSMLPRLRPRCFYDLVIEVAIVRPGPIQGKMVHPYLRRRQGKEPVEYPSEAVRQVLDKTLGVPIFQEQAMRLAVVAAGFTPGEADQLRRAMGAWRKTGVMDRFRDKLIEGMRRRGYTQEFAERVYQQICGFGEYGFPESHAASFALLVYVSAWLKCHHPAAFTAALINSQPMGFYAPAQLVADARKHGVEVRPVDVNFSDWDCTLEPVAPTGGGTSAGEPAWALRLGFRLVHGLARKAVERIRLVREDGPFRTFSEFVRRTRLSASALKPLARADAFASLTIDRRGALWQAMPEHSRDDLFDAVDQEAAPCPLAPLPPMQEVLADYGSVGLSLRRHPLSFLRPRLDSLRVTPNGRLPDLRPNLWLRVAGIVLIRQRPGTAKGITFVTLEDETGMVNLIVRRAIWERYRRVARQATAMIAHGRLQRDGDIIHVLVYRLEDLSQALASLTSQSRDFH